MGTVDVSFPNRLPNLRQVNLCCQGGSKSSQRGSVWQVGSQDGGMDRDLVSCNCGGVSSDLCSACGMCAKETESRD